MTSAELTNSEKDEVPPKDRSADSTLLGESSKESTKPDEEGNKLKINIEGDKNKLITSGRDSINIEHQTVFIIKDEDPRQSRFATPQVAIDEDLPRWFASLDVYGKLYAIAVCFYHSLKVADFLTVLPVIRSHLIRTGDIEKKGDAPLRHLGIETIEIKDVVRHALVIKFPSEKTAGEILTLLKQKYSSILFDFLSILDDVVKNNPDNWELRWRSAAALGQISELDVDHVYKTVINRWIIDDKAYVRATVGYYFYYIFDEDNDISDDVQGYLLVELKKLANPKNFTDNLWRYKWTVAATCEKIGLLENEQAENLANQYIEKVAGINHIRVADSVVHAMIEWSIKQKFPQVFRFLVSWIESGSAGNQDEDNPYEIRCIVALLAFGAIVEVNYDLLNDKDNQQEFIFPVDVLRTIWENPSGDENYWHGIISVGVRYFDFKMGHYFFDMLENWAKIVPDKEFIIEFVSSWLKEIYPNLRSKTHLENRLKNVWAKSSNKILKSIAQLTQEKIKKGI